MGGRVLEVVLAVTLPWDPGEARNPSVFLRGSPERTSGKLPERPKCSTKCTLIEPDTGVGKIVVLGVGVNREVKASPLLGGLL